MPSTSFFARVDRARSRRRGAAFTLIEAVVVLVVIGILLGIAGVAFRSVSRHQEDQAGKPLLGSAQTEARRAAASNGYLFPSDLVSRLGSRTAVVDGAGTAKITYRAEASFAPKTPGNATAGYQISTAAAGGTAAFAVETTASHCWTMIDRTNSGQVVAGSGVKSATTWGYSENIPAGQCKADLVLACPDQTAAGTVDQPSPALLGQACSAPSASFASVKCNIVDAAGSDSADVTWTEADDLASVAGYRVYAWAGTVDQSSLTDASRLSADVIRPALGSPPLPVGTTSTTVTGLAPGQDYTFAVLPEAANGATDAESVAKLRASQYRLPTARMVPAAPAPVTSSSGVKAITINWAKTTGANSYKVMRAPAPGIAWDELATVTAKDPQPDTYTYDDTSVVLRTAYSYKVVAVNDKARSDVCGINKTSGGVGPDSMVIDPAPANVPTPALTATSVDDDSSWTSPTRPTEGDDVKLTWPALADVDGYRIFRNGDPAAIATVPADEQTYVDANRPHGATTTYTAVAFVGSADSNQSNVATAYTQMDAPNLTAAAADVNGDGRTNEVALTWPAVAGAVNYTVLSCQGASCTPGPRTPAVTVTTPSWNDMTGVEGQVLRYRVVANSDTPAKIDATSSAVKQVTLTLKAPVIKAEKFDSDLSGALNDVRVTWAAVPGADGYRLYRDGVKVGADIPAGTLTSVDLNRPDGSTQFYTVVAFNSYVTSAVSNKVRVDIALDAPDLSAETVAAGSDGAENDIKLTWPAVTGTGITYDLYRVGDPTPFRTGVTTLTVTDLDRAYGATHCYTAVARSSSGASSAMSEQACADVALQAPKITGTPNNQTAVITWASVAGAEQYAVYRNPTVTGGVVTDRGTLLGTTSALTFSDTGRPWGSTATYIVVALKAGAADSAPSNVATVLHIPAVPVTDVKGSYCLRCETRLVITYPAGATSMQLYRGSTLIKTFYPSSTPNGSVYADPTGWGQDYAYTMTATNASGTSAKSAADWAYQPPASVAGLSVASGSGTTMNISWSPSAGANRYYVYVSGVNVWNGTATRYTYSTNPGQQYTVQVYAYDSNSANPNKFSRASTVKLYAEPLSASLWGESGNGLVVKVPWEFSGGYALDLGSFAVNSALAYCFDFWARGPGSQSATAWGHYPWQYVSSFRKQRGYVPPVNGGSAPGPSSISGAYSTNSEEDRLSRVLGRYGASKNDTTTTAALHFSRLITVGDATQKSYENRRWGAVVDKYGSGPTNTFNTINADGNNYEGPYVAKVAFLDKPTVGKPTRVQVSVVGVDGRRIPSLAVAVAFDRAHSPQGLVHTDSTGQATFNIVADCTGTMTATAMATNVFPEDVTIAWPKDGKVQRMMRAGLVDYSPTSTYTSAVNAS